MRFSSETLGAQQRVEQIHAQPRPQPPVKECIPCVSSTGGRILSRTPSWPRRNRIVIRTNIRSSILSTYAICTRATLWPSRASVRASFSSDGPPEVLAASPPAPSIRASGRTESLPRGSRARTTCGVPAAGSGWPDPPIAPPGGRGRRSGSRTSPGTAQCGRPPAYTLAFSPAVNAAARCSTRVGYGPLRVGYDNSISRAGAIASGDSRGRFEAHRECS